MAGAEGNCRYDLEQWKKALLSRDFDLVHTQLLILDGDLTPSERVQLVQEIFTVVQQIEELTIGKPDSQGAESPKRSAVQEPQTDHKPSATSLISRPKYRDASEERETPEDHPFEPVDRIPQRPRRSFHNVRMITDLPRNELGHKYIQCPVCDSRSNISISRRRIREDWFCNSCRLFKMRLEKKYLKRKVLPSCDHKGKKISMCKGCRRFKLELFWMDKRQDQTPYSLPLMVSDEYSHGDRSDSEGETFIDNL